MTPPFRLLVTGHRYCDRSQARYVRGMLQSIWLPLSYEWDRLIVVDGACPYGGVDRVAHLWALERPDADSERHPMRPRGGHGLTGPQRNQQMVDFGAHLCIGFPGKGSRGTWDCLTRAVNAGIPTRLYPLPPPTSSQPTPEGS